MQHAALWNGKLLNHPSLASCEVFWLTSHFTCEYLFLSHVVFQSAFDRREYYAARIFKRVTNCIQIHPYNSNVIFLCNIFFVIYVKVLRWNKMKCFIQPTKILFILFKHLADICDCYIFNWHHKCRPEVKSWARTTNSLNKDGVSKTSNQTAVKVIIAHLKNCLWVNFT